jgi:hypothetical protein
MLNICNICSEYEGSLAIYDDPNLEWT